MSIIKKITKNLILETDSYKFGHFEVMPDWVNSVHASIVPRISASVHPLVVPFGVRIWIIDNLMDPITQDNIEEAAQFCELHGVPFNREGWEYILKEYSGYLPVDIYCVPEGLPVPPGIPLVVLETHDPKVRWLIGHLEASIQRTVWPATVIATLDREFKLELKRLYELSGAPLDLLPFALHDFGARGVSSSETAANSGGAHLVNFMGSDTVEAVRKINKYYGSIMSAFSVRATEHSIECAYGLGVEGEDEYLNAVLTKWAAPGRIVSIVIDGADTMRAAASLCTKFKDKIIASGAKVVFRPDSGDMMEIVPAIVQMQAKAFGTTKRANGYVGIKHVGVIQGDGVDRLSAISLVTKLMSMGFSADVVVFGSGGALLQKINRDTLRFVMKVTAVTDQDGKWVDIVKDPITDRSKKSLAGRLSVREVNPGEYETYRLSHVGSDYVKIGEGDIMQLAYWLNADNKPRMPIHVDTLEDVRKRAAV